MADETLRETAQWMIVLHDHARSGLTEPTTCLACGNRHPCPTRRLADAYLEGKEAQYVTHEVLAEAMRAAYTGEGPPVRITAAAVALTAVVASRAMTQEIAYAHQRVVAASRRPDAASRIRIGMSIGALEQ